MNLLKTHWSGHVICVAIILGFVLSPIQSYGSHQAKHNAVSRKGLVPIGKPGRETEDVKETIHRIASVHELAEMGQYLDNESAAVLGIVLSIPVIMASQMEGMGAPGSKPTAASGKAAKDIDAVFKKFGVNTKSGKNAEEMKKLMAHGREFFNEMTKLLASIDKTNKAKSGMMKPVEKWKDTSQFKFKVIGPREVKVTPPPPDQSNMKAIVEEGFWRMHVMGMDDLKNMGMGGRR